MDISSILSRAWQIIWKHKILWIFGFFAGCVGTGGSGGGSRASYQFGSGEQVDRYLPGIQLQDWQGVLVLISIALVVFLLVLLAVFLSTVGQIGLIRGTVQARGEDEALRFGALFRGGLPFFWRVFGLKLLTGLALFAVVSAILLFGVLGSIVTLGIGLLCLIPLICLLVPLLWFAKVIIQQASIAIVVEDIDMLAGLRKGWDAVRQNLGTYIILAFILEVGIGGIGGFLLTFPVWAIIIPSVLGIAGGAPVQNMLLIAGICTIVYLPVWLVLHGALSAYLGSGWTLAYLEAKPPHQNQDLPQSNLPDPLSAPDALA